MKSINLSTKTQQLTFFALLQACVATIGSLFFSEIWELVPCRLCWFQRIFMFPLPLILAVALWRKDAKAFEYVLPVSLVGWVISLYHNYLYYYANYFYEGANETVMIACSGGVSCTSRQIEWFGFVTIPLLALTAFTVITVLMFYQKRSLLKS